MAGIAKPYDDGGDALVREAQRVEHEEAVAVAVLSSLSTEQVEALLHTRLLDPVRYLSVYAVRQAA